MSKVATVVGSIVFKKHIDKYSPPDPVYETYEDESGKTLQRKRAMPLGLSARDERVLMAVNQHAHDLDSKFNVCGFVFGWSFIITLLFPVVGDIINFLVNSTAVVEKAKEAEIPEWLSSEMNSNNFLSFLIGLIPLVGGIGVSILKCNSRNAGLLEELLALRGAEYLKDVQDRHPNVADIKPGAGLEQEETPARFA